MPNREALIPESSSEDTAKKGPSANEEVHDDGHHDGDDHDAEGSAPLDDDPEEPPAYGASPDAATRFLPRRELKRRAAPADPAFYERRLRRMARAARKVAKQRRSTPASSSISFPSTLDQSDSSYSRKWHENISKFNAAAARIEAKQAAAAAAAATAATDSADPSSAPSDSSGSDPALPAQAEMQAEVCKLNAQIGEAQALRRLADNHYLREKEKNETLTDEIIALKLHLEELTAKLAAAESKVAAGDALTTDISGKSFVASLAKPSSFSGSRQKDSLHARDWLQTINDYLNSSRIAKTVTQQIQFAETYLSGEARRTWHTIRSTLRKPSDTDSSAYAGITFEQFQQALIDRWDPACSEVNAMHQLERLQQTGSLQSFISSFDRLCSFVPDMSDREKVHRFLAQIDQGLVPLIATDPATKTRWHSYADLRTYALNYVASAPAAARRTFASKRRSGHIDGMQEMIKRHKHDGAGPSGSNGGFEVPRYHRNNNGSSGSADGSGGPFKEFKNGNGIAFTRHHKLVSWCHANSICLCCYGAYTPATASQHRQNCKQAPKACGSFPQGYSLPKSNKRT